jgi:polysaccharide pyruvyl transferase WcaK-like protein
MSKPLSIRSIGLFGTFGSGNLGDAAIQTAAIHNIKKCLPAVKIYGFAGNIINTKEIYGIESFPIYRPVNWNGHAPWRQEDTVSNSIMKKLLMLSIRFFKAIASRLGRILSESVFIVKSYKNLQKIDTLIVSGGGQIDEFWGGAWGHPYAIFKWALMVKVSKKNLIFLSVGASSLSSSLSRFFVKKALMLADYRSYRDNYSRRVVESIGATGENLVYPDLAFSLPVFPQDKSERLRGKSRLIVGVSPIAAHAWTIPEDPAYQNYLNQLKAMVLWLLQEGYTVVFFPSQTKMDTPIIKDIRKHVHDHLGPEPEDKIIEGPISTVNDLMSQILDTDIVIASRLHGVLLSHLVHKPVLAISYEKKIDTHMDDMGMSEFCLNLNQVSLPILKTRFQQLESSRDIVAGQLADKISSYQKALQEQYDRLFQPEMN